MYIWQKSGGHVQKWSWTPPFSTKASVLRGLTLFRYLNVAFKGSYYITLLYYNYSIKLISDYIVIVKDIIAVPCFSSKSCGLRLRSSLQIPCL